MLKEKCKLKIAIVDDGIDMKLLHRLMNKKVPITCLQVKDDDCVAQYTIPLKTINHGTLCTLILLEYLERLDILDDVEIMSISILDEGKQHNLQKLNKAIGWGLDRQVDMIALSIGSKEFICAGKIIDLLKSSEKNNTVIVAAGANDGVITYPACLPSVIGVKVARLASEIESVHTNPADGIDILSNVPGLNILKRLERDFSCYLGETNSLLVPVIAAEIASIILQEEKITDIDTIKKLFSKKKNLKIIRDSYINPPLINNLVAKKIEDIQIPIIAMEYHHLNRNIIENLAEMIQREFLKNEYNCAYISDMFLVNCFEKNRFRLPIENEIEWIHFYTNFLNANIIIIVSDEERLKSNISSHFIDAVISEREEHFDCPSYQLKSMDIELTSRELFEWIIRMFGD